MDERDEWLEGVRRWYFGGDAPADVTPEELAWPGSDTAQLAAECARSSLPVTARSLACEARPV